MEELRILIDYATGENWKLTITLYERYEVESVKIKPVKGQTKIEAWLMTLSDDDRKLVTKT